MHSACHIKGIWGAKMWSEGGKPQTRRPSSGSRS